MCSVMQSCSTFCSLICDINLAGLVVMMVSSSWRTMSAGTESAGIVDIAGYHVKWNSSDLRLVQVSLYVTHCSIILTKSVSLLWSYICV